MKRRQLFAALLAAFSAPRASVAAVKNEGGYVLPHEATPALDHLLMPSGKRPVRLRGEIKLQTRDLSGAGQAFFERVRAEWRGPMYRAPTRSAWLD